MKQQALPRWKRFRWWLKIRMMSDRKFMDWFFTNYEAAAWKKAQEQGFGDVDAGWERLRRAAELEGLL
jgi:hypothetical protein